MLERMQEQKKTSPSPLGLQSGTAIWKSMWRILQILQINLQYIS
ncbi:mCG148000, partial [Mus musculus]